MKGEVSCVQSIARQRPPTLTDGELAYHLLIDLMPGIMAWDVGSRAQMACSAGRVQLTVVARLPVRIEVHVLIEARGADPVTAFLGLDARNECIVTRRYEWRLDCRALAVMLENMVTFGCSTSLPAEVDDRAPKAGST